MANNEKLSAAKKEKNDEFYTQLSDIEEELKHYEGHFEGKAVYCNCDDPFESKFFEHFAKNFNSYGLKKLVATCYAGSPMTGRSPELAQFGIEPGHAYKAVLTKVRGNAGVGSDGTIDLAALFESGGNELAPLEGDGDFRSDECLALLDESDIVVSNPPFSKFRSYVATLMEHDKKFLIIGNKNAITYKELFPLLKENKVWIGYGSPKDFETPSGVTKKVNGLCRWFTNLDIPKRHQPLEIHGNKYYGNEDKYPRYANYDAIEVSKVVDIPEDYVPCWFSCQHAVDCVYAQTKGMADEALCEQACNGEIGVPITFFDKHCEEQFEIIDQSLELARPMKEIAEKGDYCPGGNYFYLDEDAASGKRQEYRYRRLYDRIVVRRVAKPSAAISTMPKPDRAPAPRVNTR